MELREIKRIPLARKVRFDILRRDLYTCQYCGAKPPNAALVIDHVHPVWAGGLNHPSNLITACEECNQGKSGTLLGENERLTGDAEMMLREALQEVMELRTFDAAAMDKGIYLAQAAIYITAEFERWAEEGVPSERVIEQMVEHYDPWIVREAAIATAKKLTAGGIHNQKDAVVKYMWGCARRIAIPVAEEETFQGAES